MRGRLVEKDVGEDYSPPRGEIPYLSDFLSWCIFQEKRTREREREGGGECHGVLFEEYLSFWQRGGVPWITSFALLLIFRVEWKHFLQPISSSSSLSLSAYTLVHQHHLITTLFSRLSLPKIHLILLALSYWSLYETRALGSIFDSGGYIMIKFLYLRA